MAEFTPTDHELRLLRYLDQHGPTHRGKLVVDLASPDSVIASRAKWSTTGQGYYRGSNGATPMIAARWCRRLIAWGFVREVRSSRYQYQHHAITAAGRQFIRQIDPARLPRP